MIGMITSLVVAFWFYHSAKKVKKDALKWLAGGMVCYYGARIVWTYLVIKPLMGRSFYDHSVMTGALIEFSAIFIGVIFVGLIYWRFLAPK